MGGSLLVFRGSLIPETTIAQYAVQQARAWTQADCDDKKSDHHGDKWLNLPAWIHLPGVTSTSQSFRVALQFAKSSTDQAAIDKGNLDDLRSVIFAICLHNYNGFHGFRMDSALYGAHTEEKEVMLMGGIRVAVLGVEEIEIDNPMEADDFWHDFNLKTVTVIYLYHTVKY